jgi:hypothetical protein
LLMLRLGDNSEPGKFAGGSFRVRLSETLFPVIYLRGRG